MMRRMGLSDRSIDAGSPIWTDVAARPRASSRSRRAHAPRARRGRLGRPAAVARRSRDGAATCTAVATRLDACAGCSDHAELAAHLHAR